MTKVYWADPEEKEEIIEFIDYVFSKAHRPHDFATLLPKLYGERGDAAPHHVIVRDGEKIVATLMAYPVTAHIGSREIVTLGIGSVSTHPRARGCGYLKDMMALVDERAREIGADYAVLSGNRQRYQYYGYDKGGYQLRASLLSSNIRHVFRDVSCEGLDLIPMTQAHVKKAIALVGRQPCYCDRREEAYLDIVRSWNNEPFALTREGEAIGFATLRVNPEGCHIAELLLEDEGDFVPAMKLITARYGETSICAAPWERRRAGWLASVCGDYAVEPNEMYKIYRPDHLKEALAELDGFLGCALPLYVAPPDAV